LGKKEEMTEGRKASRASKTKWTLPLAQGLDLPLLMAEKKVCLNYGTLPPILKHLWKILDLFR